MGKKAKKVKENNPKLQLSKEDLTIKQAALQASKTAVRISRALHLPIQFVRNGEIIEEKADGSIKTIKKLQKVKSNIDLPLGSKLCLNPKG